MTDLFILHAEADTAFVRAQLVPELGLAPDRVLLSSELPLGTSVIEAIERGVAVSRVTAAVVSPAFLHESWARFGEALASHHATHGGLLVPIVLADCTLPLRLDFRVKIDCRDAGRRASELGRLRALLALPDPPPRELPCPYPGMRPYAAEDAALFCGRDRELDKLVALIAGGVRELTVIGPSGSGKSSLLLSGLVPRLARAGDPVVGEPFAIHVVRPGSAPAQRLAPVTPGPRTLVVIDQLEEIFTLADRDGRRDFAVALDRLRAAGCHLVLALRADFTGALMQSELWPHVRRSHRHEVDPLRGDELREAITLPARRVGVELEPALLDRLLADAADEPGSLPLIQEALVHLWGARDRNLLTAAAYAALGDGARGGLAAALATRADAGFAGLDDDGQAIARRLFLRLVSFGEGRADTRRQQPLAALRAGEDPERLAAALRHLTACRLLTADGDDATGEVVVDLAHETLIASWPRLRGWIAAHRVHERLRRELEREAAAWRERTAQGRAEVGLLDDGRLVELDGWLTAEVRRDVGVSDEADAFIAASRTAAAARQAEREAHAAAEAAHERERREAEAVQLAIRMRWRARALFLVSAALVATAAQWVRALRSEREAREQTAVALRQGAVADAERRAYQRLVARYDVEKGHALLRDGRGEQAIPYLVAAREAGADGEPLRSLYRWALAAVPLARLVHDGLIHTVVWSPAEDRLATASFDGTARIWDPVTGAAGPRLLHGSPVMSVAWSADGARLATASFDGTARVWDARTSAAATAPLRHGAPVFAVAWSATGQLATASWDDAARIWDGQGHLVHELPHQGAVLGVRWSHDGTRLATASWDDTARVWDAASGREVARFVHGGSVLRVAWSPDGTRVASASSDDTARIWDAATGQPVTPPLAHAGTVVEVAWSLDGTRLATASVDGTARIWSDRGELVARLVHPSTVVALAWCAGDRLATVSGDHTARIWELATGEIVLALPAADVAVTATRDGGRIAITSADGVARAWDIRVGQPVVPAPGDDAFAWSRRPRSGESPDGTRIATAGLGAVQVSDAATGAPLASLAHEPTDLVLAVAWSNDGKLLATAGTQGTVRIWDAARWTEHLRVTLGVSVSALAWSPDDQRLATGAADRSARVWDAATGAPRSPPLQHAEPVAALAWSHDGARLATASDDDTARVWRPTGDVVSPPLAHGGDVLALAWSPDDTRLATGGEDSTARVWDAGTWQPVSPPLPTPRPVWHLRWRADGQALATGGDDDDDVDRVWTIADATSLADWRAVLARVPDRLNEDGVLIPRPIVAPP